jgi:hypothetical protein
MRWGGEAVRMLGSQKKITNNNNCAWPAASYILFLVPYRI